MRQEKALSAIADLLTNEHERVVKAASGALRNLAVDARNKELIGEGPSTCIVSLRSPGSRLAFCGDASGVEWVSESPVVMTAETDCVRICLLLSVIMHFVFLFDGVCVVF